MDISAANCAERHTGSGGPTWPEPFRAEFVPNVRKKFLVQMWNHVCALRHFSLSLIKKFLQLSDDPGGQLGSQGRVEIWLCSLWRKTGLLSPQVCDLFLLNQLTKVFN